MKEIEFSVSDFDACVQFLNAIGLQQKAHQETYREIRDLDGIQITFDERPGLKPFIEIEGASKEQVEQCISLLGYNEEQLVYGTVDELYFQELGIPHDVINNMEIITFKQPPQKY